MLHLLSFDFVVQSSHCSFHSSSLRNFSSFNKPDCTYSHFEHSSECPTCRKRLGEQDFTELVVADANNGTSDIQKTTMQALLSKKSGGGYLPHADLCQSLIRQIDASKQSTKFLLKQLLVETHKQSRGNMSSLRAHEQLKNSHTQLKQQHHSQRLQYEQTIKDLQNKLNAREGTIAELNGVTDKFRKQFGAMGARGGGGVGGGGSDSYSISSSAGPNMIPHSSSGMSNHSHPQPPLRGLHAAREASKIAQQNTMHGNSGRRPPFGNAMNGMNRSKSLGTGAGYRPSSSFSVGSHSTGGTPRIRELTANTGYQFHGVSH